MLLNDEDQKRVARAIAAIEKDTDAELVTVLARQSDDYRYIPLLWAALLSLLVPLALAFLPIWLSALETLLAQWTVLVVLGLLFRWPPLMMALVPRRVKQWRAANLARRTFLDQGLHHTKGGTGLLIFVSEAEHYVEILADRGIAEKVPDERWQSIVDTFTGHVKQGEVLNGFLECIASCGDELILKIPATERKNELPNHLVLL
ncbi:TPM domain-containing protein [Alcanivorax marinus]|uniref:TPM domain-containing protein n=1 Tax=Alloalcanivorax marinus TaxID=1177169 RepID=A0A9Q3ULQ5_9GAMM|nr:TPM domain-containing protein [Alloalcanivorax marinus]MCC4307333.1 TPM domain-containing protein [Alloalcanivorax marinus]MCH2558230.1 TPM domain-containing protein [Alcanivorax sp.]